MVLPADDAPVRNRRKGHQMGLMIAKTLFLA
jgi:hypothetical protein